MCGSIPLKPWGAITTKGQAISLVWAATWGQINVCGLCRAGHTPCLGIVEKLALKAWEQKSWLCPLPAALLGRVGLITYPESIGELALVAEAASELPEHERAGPATCLPPCGEVGEGEMPSPPCFLPLSGYNTQESWFCTSPGQNRVAGPGCRGCR